MQNDFLQTNSDFYEVSGLIPSFSAISAQVQYVAITTRLLAERPSLNAKRESSELFCFHPVNLSVGFRIPGSEQRRFRTPSLTRKLLHDGGRKVPSPTSQIPGIHKTWGLLSFRFQLKVQTRGNKGSQREGSGPGTTSRSVSWILKLHHHFLFSVVHTRRPQHKFSDGSKMNEKFRDFPGGVVVKNPPANAGDMGLIPGPGRFHMPRSNYARAPQLLSPHAATAEARAPRAHAPQQEKPPWWEAHAPQQRVAPGHHN